MKVEEIAKELNSKSPEEILTYFVSKYPHKVILGSSMGAEDQVLTDMLFRIDKNSAVFTLDTGRLFSETYELIEKTNEKYKTKIKILFPDWKKVQQMVNREGINLFYRSVDNRKLCCNIRKILVHK